MVVPNCIHASLLSRRAAAASAWASSASFGGLRERMVKLEGLREAITGRKTA